MFWCLNGTTTVRIKDEWHMMKHFWKVGQRSLLCIVSVVFWVGCAAPLVTEDTNKEPQQEESQEEKMLREYRAKDGGFRDVQPDEPLLNPEKNFSESTVPESRKSIVFQTQPCKFPGVRSLELPSDHEKQDSPRFVYHFQIVKGTKADAPYIIHLPGGPGANTIGQEQGEFPSGAFPKTHNIIQTDPRGAGCNRKKEGEFPYDFYSTRQYAQDVIEIVKALEKEKKKPLNYIVYGGSYGTIHATVFAHLAKKQGVTLPRFLVLEGVAGYGEKGFDAYLKRFQQEWQALKKTLPIVWQERFDKNQLPHANAKAWATLVYYLLIQGPTPGQEHTMHLYLKPANESHLKTFLKQLELSINPNTPAPRTFSVIACRELWGAFRLYREFVDGKFLAIGPEVCQGALKSVKRYDAKEWPLGVPVFYFQGNRDPATPYKGARYHFDVQIQTKRTFVTVENASHAPLSFNLKVKGCTSAVWDAMQHQPDKLKKALSSCLYANDSKITVETRTPKSP